MPVHELQDGIIARNPEIEMTQLGLINIVFNIVL